MKWVDTSPHEKTSDLLARILSLCYQDHRVQFLVDSGQGGPVVQRMRVALSRSRKRNEAKGRKVNHFTLHSDIYPYTTHSGKRMDCVLMWIDRATRHYNRELLDDVMERSTCL